MGQREWNINDFLEEVEGLCWKHGYEIIPCHESTDNEENCYLKIKGWKGSKEELRFWHIDGDK